MRSPAVTFTIVATIALRLSLSTAVFTIFNALVFRPDAIRDPDSLYSFTWSTHGQPRHRFTLREYDAFRRENEAFTDVAARNFDLTTRIEGHAAEGQLVSANYFQVLGVNAMLGRTLQADDAGATGGEAVVVLSYRAWQRIFASDPGIVGRTVRVNGFFVRRRRDHAGSVPRPRGAAAGRLLGPADARRASGSEADGQISR